MTQENMPSVPAESGSTARGSAGFLMIGSALIVAGYVLFGLIIGEYAQSAVYVGLALLVLLSILGIGGISLSPGTQRAAGLFMGIVVLLIVLSDLRFSDFPDGFADVLAYLAFIVGGALMFLGARGIKA
ncbi:MAG: hypothetical protein ACT4OP_08940 [Actinomycetota bacterium]